jgi:hypothetical protein
MAGTLPIRMVCFLLVVTGTAFCQQSRQTNGADPLPDAPTVQHPLNEILDAQTLDKQSLDRHVLDGQTLPDRIYLGYYQEQLKDPVDFFTKHMNPALVRRSRIYHPVDNGGFFGRMMYAASSVLIEHDEDGNRLNTPYLLSVLSAAAMHSASCPSWRRTAGQPFSDFGSTVGNDAGMNVFHEFEPGFRDLLKNHEPKFVDKIERHFHK